MTTTPEVAATEAMPKPAPPLALVIFGASGDLTSRKILPALYQLHKHGLIGAKNLVLGVSRDTDMTDEKLEERLYGTVGSKQGHRRRA